MKDFIQSRIASFKYAFSGWWYMLRTQQNAWIHAAASLIIILVSFWFRLNAVEWALIVVAIAAVWIAEFFNTAIESVVDLVTEDHEPLAKAAKDVAAAAVLLAAGMAVVIGVLVLGPPLLGKLQGMF